MGAADTIPGVSGGTIALITGIYERLVTALAALDPSSLRHLRRPHDPRARAALWADVVEMDAGFLVVLALGIGTAVVGLSRVVAFALAELPAETNAFFFGLVAASAVVLYGEVRLDTLPRIGSAVIAIVFAFFVTGLTGGGNVSHALPVVFVTGAVASSAMLLPGISGAAFLYLLGQYEFMVGSLHTFLGALPLVVSGRPAVAFTSGIVVAAFLAGVLLGLLTVAHAVRWALSADRGTTLTVLVSLMVGALRFPAEATLVSVPRWTPAAAVAVGFSLLVGVGAVLALGRYTDDLDY